MLPEQEEEAEQREGRVKAENDTSQEAGFFRPRRRQEKDREVRVGTPACTHVHTSTCTYVIPGCLFSGVQAGAQVRVCVCVCVTNSLSTVFFPSFFSMLEVLQHHPRAVIVSQVAP